MKVTPACRLCLEKLVLQTAELAADSPSLQQKARVEGLKVLEKRYARGGVSTRIASEVHRVIRKVTGNPDPFAPMKRREIRIALDVFASINPGGGGGLDSYIKLAISGNAIDFFLDTETIRRNLSRPVLLAVDDTREVARKVNQARKILYLADNAGECFFDLPLVRYLSKKAEPLYVVKGSPVQNDITSEDMELAGMRYEMGRVITTGNDFVGLDLDTASEEFIREFYRADLIIAKGMGHYETISELEPDGRVAFLLKAKCQPVADALGVPLNACVVKLY